MGAQPGDAVESGLAAPSQDQLAAQGGQCALRGLQGGQQRVDDVGGQVASHGISAKDATAEARRDWRAATSSRSIATGAPLFETVFEYACGV